MQSEVDVQSLLKLRKAAAVSIVFGVHLALTWPVCGALESGVYQTIPGATVEERGDTVPNGSRIVPIFATLTFDLGPAQPSLTAVIPNAVLEGGDPFALIVRSSSGAKLVGDTYQFTGDYLRETNPSGTQYLFDWRFSTAGDGRIVWNGITQWAGGHIWQVTISDVTLVPEPSTPTLISIGIGFLWAGRVLRGAGLNKVSRANRVPSFSAQRRAAIG